MTIEGSEGTQWAADDDLPEDCQTTLPQVEISLQLFKLEDREETFTLPVMLMSVDGRDDGLFYGFLRDQLLNPQTHRWMRLYLMKHHKLADVLAAEIVHTQYTRKL